MSYIVDKTFFIKELSVPNINETRDVSGGTDTFDMTIDKESRSLLEKALGFILFEDLDSNITDGVLDIGAPSKWQNLVNGITYVKDGESFRWKGLIYTEGAFKGSLLAQYVFVKWHKEHQSQVTGTGEATGDSINATRYNSTQRLVTIWNDFLINYGDIFSSIGSFYNYRGIPVRDFGTGASTSNYVSLLTYLKDNDTDYPEAALIDVSQEEPQNQLGL